MGQSAEDLRRDIEHTPQNLGSTVDAIGDRVSPGRIVERRANRVRGSIRSLKETVMGTASDATSAEGERMGGAASGVAGAASGVAQRAGTAVETLASAPQAAAQTATRQAPLAAGLVAFGAGAMVAAPFKPARTEGQAAQALVSAPIRSSRPRPRRARNWRRRSRTRAARR